MDGHKAELMEHKRFGELVEVDALLKAMKNTPSPEPEKPLPTARMRLR